MPFYDVVGADEEFQLPAKVRTRTAQNISDQSTPEGAAVLSVAEDAVAPINEALNDIRNGLLPAMTEDPNDPGTFIIQSPYVSADPGDPGFFIVGYSTTT